MVVTTQSHRKAALAFIFVTVLIDMLAFGMIIPVLPLLVQDFVGGGPARAAQMYGLFGTAWALMQFIFSPVQGSLSDHFLAADHAIAGSRRDRSRVAVRCRATTINGRCSARLQPQAAAPSRPLR